MLLIFIGISAILSPNFLTINNFLNLLQQASIPGIVAIAMTLVILLGGIDLSVGSVLAFAGMICAIIVDHFGGTVTAWCWALWQPWLSVQCWACSPVCSSHAISFLISSLRWL